MSETTVSGAEFKKQLRDGVPKLGLFVNSHSATVTEQLAHSGYDWLLIDTQHEEKHCRNGRDARGPQTIPEVWFGISG